MMACNSRLRACRLVRRGTPGLRSMRIRSQIFPEMLKWLREKKPFGLDLQLSMFSRICVWDAKTVTVRIKKQVSCI